MDDDTLDAIDASEFWLHDTALDAHSMPVQSLAGFWAAAWRRGPRDGIQRPLLTNGSPSHAPVPRRTSKQPVNITHVHQTVVQNFGHVPAACPATVAEGTSGLSCLESALAVPQGSVYKPASRWKHRSKTQVAAGVAKHVHDGTITFGTSLPAMSHAPASDVVTADDCLSMIATPAITTVPPPDGVTAAAPGPTNRTARARRDGATAHAKA